MKKKPLKSIGAKRFWLSIGLLLLITMSAIGLWSGAKADAASAVGCEHHAVSRNRQQYYLCLVETPQETWLPEHNASSFAVESTLPTQAVVYVAKQVRLRNHVVNGSSIWDVLQNGLLVSDDYINTGRYNAFSPPIPNGSLPVTPTGAATSTSTRTSTPGTTPTSIPGNTPTVTSTPGSGTPEPVGQTGTWKMLFHDDFTGNALDTSKWNTCFFNFHITGTQDCTHDQSELELYQPANVTVSNGTLNLTAQKQNVIAGGRSYAYTSGMISSGPATDGAPAKFSFQYGYMETRAKVPAGQGFWPAFWTLATDESYPPEIDVFEILGNTPTVDNMHYHWPDGSSEGADEGSEWAGPDFSAGWHTFAVDWEPGSLTWYVDGVARFHTGSHVTSKPQYLIANLAVGGGWPGNPDAGTPFPSALQMEYIRVWQKG